jgi:CheY-like chemotaxis protein
MAGQASILVVDDEPGVRNFLARILKPRCKRIEEASDAKEASRKLDEQHFDLVILDNIMPGKSGLDWLAAQRAIGFFADGILMTAYADLDTSFAGAGKNAAPYRCIERPIRTVRGSVRLGVRGSGETCGTGSRLPSIILALHTKLEVERRAQERHSSYPRRSRLLRSARMSRS